ncbi:hypothetical protein [Bacillus sp. 2205SS5-2]|uniref:hypothetical protein n=1 Tax=Bacillus sp. 2205SS5-2 TaxID=3109031 RepID=UPI00300562E7
MRIFFVLVVIVLLYSGCSSTEKTTSSDKAVAVNPYETAELSFDADVGNIVVVYDAQQYENGRFKVIISLRNLDPAKMYSVTLEREGGGFVAFGPKHNVEIQVGSIRGDTFFQPNANGDLAITVENPVRILSREKEAKIMIKEKDSSEPFSSSSFLFKGK